MIQRILGAGLVLVIVLAIAGGGVWFALSHSTYDSTMLPTISIKYLLEEVATFVTTQLIVTALGVVSWWLFIKLVKKFAIRFLDRQLPSEKPIGWVKKLAFRIFKRELPSAKSIKDLSDEDLKKEYVSTQLGERHEATVYESWWATTFTRALGIVVGTFALAWVGAGLIYVLTPFDPDLSARIKVNLFVLWAILLPVSIWYFWIEWGRLNRPKIFTNQRVIKFAAHGGFWGLLFGGIADVRRSETPLELPREPITATDPRRIKDPDFKGDDLLNEWLDILGRWKGLRTIFLTSYYNQAADMLEHLEFGNAAARILFTLSGENSKLKGYLSRVTSTRDGLIAGSPADPNWDYDASMGSANDYYNLRTAHISPKPGVLNLIAAKTDPGHWDLKTGKRTELGARSQGNTATAPSARSHQLLRPIDPEEITSSGNTESSNPPAFPPTNGDWVP